MLSQYEQHGSWQVVHTDMKTSNILLSATRDCAKVKSAPHNSTVRRTLYPPCLPVHILHCVNASSMHEPVGRLCGRCSRCLLVSQKTRPSVHLCTASSFALLLQVGDVGLARVLDNVTHHSNVMEWVRRMPRSCCCHVHR